MYVRNHKEEPLQLKWEHLYFNNIIFLVMKNRLYVHLVALI